MSNATPVMVNINGVDLPLRPFQVKDKDHFWFSLSLTRKSDGERYPATRGVKLSAEVFGVKDPDALPSVVMLGDVEVFLTPGETASGNPKMSCVTQVDHEGEDKNLNLNISNLGDGRWNIIGKLYGVGGGTKRVMHDVSDL